jgi:hypothetical protein
MIQLTNGDDDSILVNTNSITYVVPLYANGKIVGSNIVFGESRSIYVKQRVESILELIKGIPDGRQ